jgi:hypothetical protein
LRTNLSMPQRNIVALFLLNNYFEK